MTKQEKAAAKRAAKRTEPTHWQPLDAKDCNPDLRAFTAAAVKGGAIVERGSCFAALVRLTLYDGPRYVQHSFSIRDIEQAAECGVNLASRALERMRHLLALDAESRKA